MIQLKHWGLTAAVATLLVVQPGLGTAETLPRAAQPFAGKIDPARDKSTPAWPVQTKAPAGAPNIVLVLLDDVGYGSASVFGGPVQTPGLEQLASQGLRYNSFHVNSLCSPTRAALLSGRNSHQLGFGTVIEGATGYPGYNSIWPKNAVSVAEVLRQNGYSTAAFGKWHNTPAWEITETGPFDHWPTSLGFEYWYGFQSGWDNQWEPRLYRNTVAVEPPRTPAQGYHLTTDLADDAIHWLHKHEAVSAEKPFFLYFATGAIHTPHHVPQQWIARYRGQFDQGWDELRKQTFARQKKLGVIPANAELTPRPAELPAWNSLSPPQKKLYARQAEVAAGFLAQTDFEVNRILSAIKEEGQADNTIVFYIVGDNGASGEGGLEGLDLRTSTNGVAPVEQRLAHLDQLGSDEFYNHYSAAWAWALDTPFQWTKQVASHLGGTTDPLIVSWPARIKDKGGLRTQFQHVNDIAPTIYDIAGITFPDRVNGVEQLPLEGKSLAYTFDHPQEPTHHTVQYFELGGNRGIYQDGWWAGIRYLLPWQGLLPEKPNEDVSFRKWELYNLKQDFSQAHDLSARNPAKLRELQTLFDSEARRNQVYPLAPIRASQPNPADGKNRFVYREGVNRLTLKVLPDLAAHSHSLSADVTTSVENTRGVIVAEGGRWGGYTLFVKDGKLIYEANSNGVSQGQIISSQPLATGKNHIVVDVQLDPQPVEPNFYPHRNARGATAKLLVNGVRGGETHFEVFGGFLNETLDLGSDLGTPVSRDYTTPFTFTGTVEQVALEVR
jgi:arylsulfatase A-like enzyme